MDHFEFVDKAYGVVCEKREAQGAGSLSEKELSLYLVWSASGLIENGGYRYFLECGMNVPETGKAFENVGLPNVATVFQKVVALLPSDFDCLSYEKKLEAVEAHSEELDNLTNEMLDASDVLESSVYAFIST